MQRKKFEDSVDLDLIARKTIGYSGADLENLLNEAAIMAAREGRKKINQNDLTEAYLKVKLGRKRKGRVVKMISRLLHIMRQGMLLLQSLQNMLLLLSRFPLYLEVFRGVLLYIFLKMIKSMYLKMNFLQILHLL